MSAKTPAHAHRQVVGHDRDSRRHDTLEKVRGALGREVSVLTERPELTWQQLHNRLQWAGPPLAERLAAERERRSSPGSRPWFHRYTRLRESEALVRTLGGHTGVAWSCAVSPDGTRIVAGGDNGTLQVWDAATGTERATLKGHGDNAVRQSHLNRDGEPMLTAAGSSRPATITR